MQTLAVKRTIWDFWAPRYHRLWVQRVSLGPTREIVRNHIRSLATAGSPCRILDVGCGIGQLARELADDLPAAEILGIDVSATMIDRANALHAHPRISYACAELSALTNSQPFDLIVSTHAFPYIPDAQAAMGVLYRLTAPSGRVLIAHANRESLFDHVILRLVELTTTHANYRSVQQLSELVAGAGFALQASIPIRSAWFVPTITLVEGRR